MDKRGIFITRNMMKNTAFIIGIVTLILAGILGRTFGREIGDEVYKNLFQRKDTKPAIISTTGLTQAHKDGHIKSCIQSGGNQEYCECTFEYIKDKITPAELKEYAIEYQTSQVLPDIFKDALAACISKAEPSSSSTPTHVQSVNTNLEIEKCKVSSQNASIFEENERFAEVVNEMVRNGINLSNEQIRQMFQDNEKDYRNSLYENCLNKI